MTDYVPGISPSSSIRSMSSSSNSGKKDVTIILTILVSLFELLFDAELKGLAVRLHSGIDPPWQTPLDAKDEEPHWSCLCNTRICN